MSLPVLAQVSPISWISPLEEHWSPGEDRCSGLGVGVGLEGSEAVEGWLRLIGEIVEDESDGNEKDMVREEGESREESEVGD